MTAAPRGRAERIERNQQTCWSDADLQADTDAGEVSAVTACVPRPISSPKTVSVRATTNRLGRVRRCSDTGEVQCGSAAEHSRGLPLAAVPPGALVYDGRPCGSWSPAVPASSVRTSSASGCGGTPGTPWWSTTP